MMMQLDFFSENSMSQSNLEPISSVNLRTPLETAYNIATFGQVFTPDLIVNVMLALRKNQGRVLEPSCGDGAFFRQIPNCVGLEIDSTHAPDGCINSDFFTYPESEKFETIIGNPPYVRYQDIFPETKKYLKSSLFDLRSNLYLFFIEKAVRHLKPHGELIFITPRDFLKTTSSVKLNQWLYTQGTITHAIELGDARIFAGAVPNCLIWRFEKDCFNREMHYAEVSNKDDLSKILINIPWETRYFLEESGHFMFTKSRHGLILKQIASVKVGAVSGADSLFANPQIANREFVGSSTAKTGKTKSMFYPIDSTQAPADLLPYKEQLLQRKIRQFDESNWWHWGRGYPQTDAPRVYVNGKTRHPQPFFLHECTHFDGSILAVFPHQQDIDLAAFCAALNAVAWDELGFVCDGRFIFSQRSLENAPLPESFQAFLP